jgi:predicted DNA-binding transcriptional regulator AlpA
MTAVQRAEVLPISLPPRGLSREQAAAYIGVSPALFDEMVKDGRMPKPKRPNTRTIWDRRQLDRAFDRLPGGDLDESDDEWDFEV